MTRIGAKLACGLLVALMLGGESPRAQVSVGPQGPEQGVIRRQTWLIPAQGHATLMRTMVIRPPGEGPFPLAVINHGSTQNQMRWADHRLPQYDTLAQWLTHAPQAVAVWGPIVERLLQSMT